MQAPFAPPPTAPSGCNATGEETCEYAADGECDDGGVGSEFDDCGWGTDCSDCGLRFHLPPSPPMPPLQPHHGFTVVSNGTFVNWFGAEALCQNQHGSLASIRSAQDNDEIVMLLRQLPGGGSLAWIGARVAYRGVHGVRWRWWSDGDQFPALESVNDTDNQVYANWDGEMGEPSNSVQCESATLAAGAESTRDCAAIEPWSRSMDANRRGKWFTELCQTRVLLYAVCHEIAPPPSPPPSLPPILVLDPAPPPLPPFHGFSVIDMSLVNASASSSAQAVSFVPWAAASMHCNNALQGVLASIRTAAENELVLSLLQAMPGGAGQAWLGGRLDEHDGMWRWQSGGDTFPGRQDSGSGDASSSGYAGWDYELGEPKLLDMSSQQAAASCASIDPSARSTEQRRGKWFSESCERRVLRYAVCQEIAPPPSPPPSPLAPPPVSVELWPLALGFALLALALAAATCVLYRRRAHRARTEASMRKREADARAKAAEVVREAAAEEQDGFVSFYFVPRAVVLDMNTTTEKPRLMRRPMSSERPYPHHVGNSKRSMTTTLFPGHSLRVFQALLAQGHVQKRAISIRDAMEGKLAATFVAVSHRWETPTEPDVQGDQLAAIQQYLHDHEEVQFVWYDFWCMPQGKSVTPAERASFEWMLKRINLLYLGARVLILLDLSYQSRFWTQFEAWLSFQATSRDGLAPAAEGARRCTIVPVHGANSIMAEGLVAMWARRTLTEAHEVLAEPDVMVTNQKDKDTQLPKILSMDDEVRRVLRGVESEVGVPTVRSEGVITHSSATTLDSSGDTLTHEPPVSVVINVDHGQAEDHLRDQQEQKAQQTEETLQKGDQTQPRAPMMSTSGDDSARVAAAAPPRVVRASWDA